MKSLLKWALVLPLVASVTLVGCNKDDDDDSPAPVVNNPVEGKMLIFEETSSEADVDVKVYADEALFVGYNRMYVMLYEAGTKNVVEKAEVMFMPDMTMMSGMNHGCPVENPMDMEPKDGLFEGAIVFVMPSAGNGSWNLKVMVKNNGMEGSVESEVIIAAPTTPKMYSFISPTTSEKIFVSLVEPMNPEVGVNDFEVCIHKKMGMMDWPAATNMMVEIEPEMPTMGHGSPGNVNPVHTANGHYVGAVNFTMTGMWYVNMTIKEGTDVLDDMNYFELTF
jgi:hypothetical protein